jgi:hypothetical protein
VRDRPRGPTGANGRLPDSQLAGVGDGKRMYAPAAAAFRDMMRPLGPPGTTCT